MLRRRGGTRSEVKKAYDLAVADQKTHLDAKPADAVAAAEKARYLNNLGILQADVNPAAAFNAFNESQSILFPLLKATQSVPSLRALAACENNIGQLFVRAKDDKDASIAFENANDDLVWLSQNYPGIPDYRAERRGVDLDRQPQERPGRMGRRRQELPRGARYSHAAQQKISRSG